MSNDGDDRHVYLDLPHSTVILQYIAPEITEDMVSCYRDFSILTL